MPGMRRPSYSGASARRGRPRPAAGLGADFLAQPEAGEAAHHDVLLEHRDLLLDELAHGHLGLLDEGLLEQAEGLVVLLELALGDLLHHRRGLALGRRLGAVDLLLLLQRLRRDLLLGHVEGGGGGGRGHVHGDVLHQGLEVGGAGHEVGLAVHLHEHADARRPGDGCRSRRRPGWPRARPSWRRRPGPSCAGSPGPSRRRPGPPRGRSCSPSFPRPSPPGACARPPRRCSSFVPHDHVVA